MRRSCEVFIYIDLKKALEGMRQCECLLVYRVIVLY